MTYIAQSLKFNIDIELDGAGWVGEGVGKGVVGEHSPPPMKIESDQLMSWFNEA